MRRGNIVKITRMGRRNIVQMTPLRRIDVVEKKYALARTHLRRRNTIDKETPS